MSINFNCSSLLYIFFLSLLYFNWLLKINIWHMHTHIPCIYTNKMRPANENKKKNKKKSFRKYLHAALSQRTKKNNRLLISSFLNSIFNMQKANIQNHKNKKQKWANAKNILKTLRNEIIKSNKSIWTNHTKYNTSAMKQTAKRKCFRTIKTEMLSNEIRPCFLAFYWANYIFHSIIIFN